MAGMRLGEASFLVYRFDAHLPHECPYMAPADPVAPVQKLVLDAPRPPVRLLQMDFVNETHEFTVPVVHQYGPVVDARPGEVENLALLRQR